MLKRTSGSRREHGLLTGGGFTLVELLVVVVILGILATVGVRMIRAREMAYIAVMKADLRNLASEQAPYAIDNYEYASNVADLKFTISEGVTLELLGEETGFTARTTHVGLPNGRCALYMGTVSSVYSPATVEGRVTCDGAAAVKGKGKDGDSCGVGVPSSKAKAQGEAC